MNYIPRIIYFSIALWLPLHIGASLDLSDGPLNSGKSSPPLVMLMFDDSVSMKRHFIPETPAMITNDITLLRDPDINKLYYNPSVTYPPRINADGTSAEDGPLVAFYDLISEVTANKYHDKVISESEPHYYVDGNKVVVTGDELRNYNNWYSYYRTRLDAAKTSIGFALQKLPTDYSLGLWVLNKDLANLAPTIPIQEYSTTNKGTFYTTLYGIESAGKTPLRSTLAGIGEYFSQTTIDSLDCRGYYNIMMTDGYWNGPSPEVGNVDNQSYSVSNKDGDVIYDYTPAYPYADKTPNTLADIALKYWQQDLRPDLNNNVATGTSGANWQRLVNYTIGFGFEEAITNKPPAEWPAVGSNKEENIYDLWHTAINSRGEYYNASDPTLLAAALQSIIQEISTQSQSTASAIAIDSTSLVNNDALVYQASYDSSNWSGNIEAYNVSANDGNINTSTSVWAANEQMPTPDTRVIFTKGYKKGAQYMPGVPFRFEQLSGQQGRKLVTGKFNLAPQSIPYGGYIYQGDDDDDDYDDYDDGSSQYITTTVNNWSQVANVDDLGSLATLSTLNGISDWSQTSSNSNNTVYHQAAHVKDLVSYLRGSATHEDGTTFHDRYRPKPEQAPLGDIINSGLVFVDAVPPFNYPEAMSAGSYQAFKNKFQSNPGLRESMLYVMSNDGFLHGFSATTGQEKMAYVPEAIMDKLSNYAETGFSHKYLADGTPDVGDAYFNGEWHTVLASGLGAGGQSVFALNITTTNFSETRAGNTVLWEFSDEDDSDMGNTFGKLSINYFNNGRWGVVVPNGYNSDLPDEHTGSGQAVLYILFLDKSPSGQWQRSISGGKEDYIKIVVPNNIAGANNNGLSEASAIDVLDTDGKRGKDHRIDYIYAGDYQGNVWKFDVTSSNPANWDVASDANDVKAPLFTTPSVTSNGQTRPQPITAGLEVGKHPKGGQLIYFGTGSYITKNDPSNQFHNDFYAIWDNGDRLGITADQLLEQAIINEQVVHSDKNVRITTDHEISWDNNTRPPKAADGHLGWRIRLSAAGERVVNSAVLNSGYIYFNTLKPENTAYCQSGGGSGWFMALNAINGGRTLKSPIDVNHDSEINDKDLVTIDSGVFAISGIQSTVGLPTPLRFVKLTDNLNMASYGGSNGEVETHNTVGSSSEPGRQSWRVIVGYQ